MPFGALWSFSLTSMTDWQLTATLAFGATLSWVPRIESGPRRARRCAPAVLTHEAPWPSISSRSIRIRSLISSRSRSRLRSRSHSTHIYWKVTAAAGGPRVRSPPRVHRAVGLRHPHDRQRVGAAPCSVVAARAVHDRRDIASPDRELCPCFRGSPAAGGASAAGRPVDPCRNPDRAQHLAPVPRSRGARARRGRAGGTSRPTWRIRAPGGGVLRFLASRHGLCPLMALRRHQRNLPPAARQSATPPHGGCSSGGSRP